MSRKWTAAQSAAMTVRDKTLLVSAAAGSGKTATLTERIIRSITDPTAPADISKMLIVTFTRAAAEELKSRIFSALSNALAKDPTNRYLTNQMVKLGSAKICTIDAFYLELLRANFSSLELSASFRIADTAELEVLAKSIMEQTLESFYDTSEDFESFVECFTGTRSADQLSDILLRFFEKIQSVPEGIDFLEKQAEQTRRDAELETDFFATQFGAIVRGRAIDIAAHCHSVFEQACDYFSTNEDFGQALLPSFLYDREFCESLLVALSDKEHGYQTTQALLATFAPVRIKRLKPDQITEESEQYKALRTDLHKQLRELYKKSFSKSSENIVRAMKETAHYIHVLYTVLRAYEQTMQEEKRRRNVVDFNDVRRYTLKLLVNADGSPTEIAKQYAEQFSDVYIDEYQDVDRVQDMIFRAISRPNNRFMVGDIKQSIYSFRGAEPQVFSDYRTAFPAYASAQATASDCVSIFMSENFRCDSAIIDFTNLICSRVFSVCPDSIGYQKEDDLVCAKLPPSDSYQAPKVEVTVILNQGAEEEVAEPKETASTQEDETPQKQELEAAYIATEIQRLLTTERKADGSPIRPGDIAVLFRSRSMSSFVSKALAAKGILSSENDGDRYFENADVLMVLCLLNSIDNPHRDIFLTGTLRSPLFGFDMNDIIRIRTHGDASLSLYDALLSYKESETDELAARCADFDHLLTQWKQHSLSLSVDRFLQFLFETELFVASGLVSAPNETGDGGNLLRLYEYARSFESGSFKGLYNFIEFINTLIEEGKKMKVPPKGVSPDRVNLMTIHQSKGLEFPVCFLCGAAKRFNRQDQHASLLFEYPLGVAMKLSDTTGFARINTPMREALAASNGIKQSEEEMRVLYVALTRARERLYVTASTGATKEKLLGQAAARAAFCDRHSLLHCNSFLDWILIPFADTSVQSDCARLSFVTPTLTQEQNATTVSTVTDQPSLKNEELYRRLKEKFSFRYSYASSSKIPAKLSVSRLSPDILDENDTSADLISEKKSATVPPFFLSDQSVQGSAAERGTATHLFLQFCDFGRLKRLGVKNEIGYLTEKGFLPAAMEPLIRINELTRFLTSDLFGTIETASRIIREQRFNVLLPAALFSQDPPLQEQLKKEELAVQGVIDLILIDEKERLCLFDYKTDRLTEEELNNDTLAAKRLTQRHGLQLSYYAYAVSLLFDRPCDRIGIYSTHAGKVFDLSPPPLSLPSHLVDTV